RRPPDHIGHDLEVGEDVGLVPHMSSERRAEHGPEDLEEGLRCQEEREDVHPRTEGREVNARGGYSRDRDDAGEDEERQQQDERHPDPQERSRLSPGRDPHRWCEREPRYLMAVPRLSPLKGVTHPRGRKATRGFARTARPKTPWRRAMSARA